MDTTESILIIGCTIRNQKDPYQIQCVFSSDPGDKRDFSMYFYSDNGQQDLVVRCTHNERYECIVPHEGLSVTEDLITVSETFPKQNGSFVCRNGGPSLDDFPCFYSGNSVKPAVKYGAIENGPNTFLKPEECGTEEWKDVFITIQKKTVQSQPEQSDKLSGDNNAAVIIAAVLGVVVIIQFLVIGFLLLKNYPSRKCFKKQRSKKERRSPIELEPDDVPVSGKKQNEDSEKNQNRMNEERWSFISGDNMEPNKQMKSLK